VQLLQALAALLTVLPTAHALILKTGELHGHAHRLGLAPPPANAVGLPCSCSLHHGS
jgi:hypothetical protein